MEVWYLDIERQTKFLQRLYIVSGATATYTYLDKNSVWQHSYT